MSGPVVKGPEVKGWCPGALRPMLAGDGWVVRVRPLGGRLTQDQAGGIARLALAHGNGWLDLSSRANLQIRGVSEASHTPLIMGLRGLGLVDATPEAETRRNVLVTPLWTVGDGVQTLALELSRALGGNDLDLPAKFGFAVDCGAAPVLRGASADIRIERDAAGLILRADGLDWGWRVTADEAVPVALDLARWFLETGGVREGRGRMAAHVLNSTLIASFGRSALTRRKATEGSDKPPLKPPLPGPCAPGFLAALAFGQMRAETLREIADLGAIRLTPWRMVLIEGLGDAPVVPDLITAPDDALLRVIACTGAPGCPQGHQPTRPLARQLAPLVADGQRLHVSGCAKGCAHPASCDVTLTAAPGGFHLNRNAKAAYDGPQHNAETLLEMLP